MRTPPTSRIILPYIAEIEKWLQIFLQSFSHIFLFMARKKWEESRAARDEEVTLMEHTTHASPHPSG